MTNAELQILLTLKDKFTKELQQIEKKSGKSFTQMGVHAENFGRKMSSAGMQLTRTVTLPLVALGVLASKAAIDYETAFAGVRKTVDATEAEFAKLSEGIRKFATIIPASTTEIARITEAAGQLGIQKKNLLSFTRVMVDLGNTTNMAGEQAATALARLANITQMPQENFDRLGSTIVDLGNNLATTEGEIVEMGLRLAGAGKQVGISVPKIMGLAAALSSVGIESQAGGSAFSRIMIKIADSVASNSKELKTFAEVAGVSIKEFQKLFKEDAATALIAVVSGLDRMSKSGENVFGILEELGFSNIRITDALLRASSAEELFTRSLEMGSNAWEKNTALTDEAQKRYDTMASKLKILKAKAMELAITFGESLMPIIDRLIKNAEPLLKKLKEFTDWFAQLDPKMQSIIIGLGALAAAMGPVLYILGQLAISIGVLIPLMATLKTAVVSLTVSFGSMALGLGAVALAAGGVIYGLRKIGEAMNAGQRATNKSKDALADWLLEVRKSAPDVLRISEEWQKTYKTATNLLLTYQQTGSEEALNNYYDYMTQLTKMRKDFEAENVPSTVVPGQGEELPTAAWFDKYRAALFGQYALSSYLLDEEYHKKLKQGEDKLLVDQWYAWESSRIDKEYYDNKEKGEREAQKKILDATKEHINTITKYWDDLTLYQKRAKIEELEATMNQLEVDSETWQLYFDNIKTLQETSRTGWQAYWQDLNTYFTDFGKTFWDIMGEIMQASEYALSSNLAKVMKNSKEAGNFIKNVWADIKDYVIDMIAKMMVKYAAFLAMQVVTGGSFSIAKFFGFSDGGVIKGEGMPHAQHGLITGGSGYADTIPIMARPRELIAPLEDLPRLIPKIVLPQPAYAGAGGFTLNIYGDIKTKADEEELFPMLENFYKKVIRGS